MSDYEKRTPERLIEILDAQDQNPRSWQREAANEIERLRAQLTEWQDDYAALKKARASDLNDALSHLRAGIDKLRHTSVEIPIELHKACHALTHIVVAVTDEQGKS